MEDPSSAIIVLAVKSRANPSFFYETVIIYLLGWKEDDGFHFFAAVCLSIHHILDWIRSGFRTVRVHHVAYRTTLYGLYKM